MYWLSTNILVFHFLYQVSLPPLRKNQHMFWWLTWLWWRARQLERDNVRQITTHYTDLTGWLVFIIIYLVDVSSTHWADLLSSLNIVISQNQFCVDSAAWHGWASGKPSPAVTVRERLEHTGKHYMLEHSTGSCPQLHSQFTHRRSARWSLAWRS